MHITNAHPGKFFSQAGCNSVSNRRNFPCLRGEKTIVDHGGCGKGGEFVGNILKMQPVTHGPVNVLCSFNSNLDLICPSLPKAKIITVHSQKCTSYLFLLYHFKAASSLRSQLAAL